MYMSSMYVHGLILVFNKYVHVCLLESNAQGVGGGGGTQDFKWRDDQRIFGRGGLKFSILGFFWVTKIWQVFFWVASFE